jgi:hypothetical protein
MSSSSSSSSGSTKFLQRKNTDQAGTLLRHRASVVLLGTAASNRQLAKVCFQWCGGSVAKLIKERQFSIMMVR